MDKEIRNTATLYGLKSIRLFCFLAIYLGHTYPSSGVFSNLSFLSISIYIILSSFILSYRYQNENVDCTIKGCVKFAINRIKKLYPLHIITTIIFFVFFSYVSIYSGGFDGWNNLISPALIEQVFLIQSWSLNYEIMRYCNAVSWFLSAILFLYFLFPLIRKYTKNLGIKKSLLVILIIVLFQALIYPLMYPFVTKYVGWSEATYYFPLARVGEFVCGSCLFNIWCKVKDRIDIKLSNILELLQLIIVVLFSNSLITRQIPYRSFVATIIAMFSIFLFANCKGFIAKSLTNKMTVKLGDYSNYAWLIHCFFVQFLPFICMIYNLNVPTIIYVIIGVALSLYLSYLYSNIINRKKDNLIIDEKHIYEIDLIKVFLVVGITSLNLYYESGIKISDILKHTNVEYRTILYGCFIVGFGFFIKDRYPKVNNLKKYLCSGFEVIYPCFWLTLILFSTREYWINGITFFNSHPLTYLLNITGFNGFLYGGTESLYLIGEWFIGAIIVCYIIYPIIDKIINKKKNLLYIVLSFCILHILCTKFEISRLDVSDQCLITCILEVLLGVCLYQSKDKWNNKFFLFISLFVYVIPIFIKLDCYLYMLMPIHAVSLYMLLYNIGTVFNNNVVYRKTIRFLSRYSYSFFLVQHIVIHTLICRFSPSKISEVLIIVFLSVAISFILSILIYHTSKKIYYLLIQSDNRRRNIIITIILFIAIIFSINAYQYIKNKNSVIENLEDYTICNSSINYYVDSALIVGNEVVMKGWAYPLDKNVVNFEIGVEVYGKIYIADKTYRDDVQEVFSLESNLVGFTIFLNNNEYYQICIIDKNNKVIYK